MTTNKPLSSPWNDLLIMLTEALETENKFYAENVIREMASRRGITKQEMAQAIREGRLSQV